MKKQRVKVDKLETEVGGKQSRKTMFNRESLTPEGSSTRTFSERKGFQLWTRETSVGS